jgi:hypothetical protein
MIPHDSMQSAPKRVARHDRCRAGRHWGDQIVILYELNLGSVAPAKIPPSVVREPNPERDSDFVRMPQEFMPAATRPACFDAPVFLQKLRHLDRSRAENSDAVSSALLSDFGVEEGNTIGCASTDLIALRSGA